MGGEGGGRREVRCGGKWRWGVGCGGEGGRGRGGERELEEVIGEEGGGERRQRLGSGIRRETIVEVGREGNKGRKK